MNACIIEIFLKRSVSLSRQGNRVQPPVQASTANRQPAEPAVSQQHAYRHKTADADGLMRLLSVGSFSRHGPGAASPSRIIKAVAVKGSSSTGAAPRAASGTSAGMRPVPTVPVMPTKQLSKFPSTGRG